MSYKIIGNTVAGILTIVLLIVVGFLRKQFGELTLYNAMISLFFGVTTVYVVRVFSLKQILMNPGVYIGTLFYVGFFWGEWSKVHWDDMLISVVFIIIGDYVAFRYMNYLIRRKGHR